MMENDEAAGFNDGRWHPADVVERMTDAGARAMWPDWGEPGSARWEQYGPTQRVRGWYDTLKAQCSAVTVNLLLPPPDLWWFTERAVPRTRALAWLLDESEPWAMVQGEAEPLVRAIIAERRADLPQSYDVLPKHVADAGADFIDALEYVLAARLAAIESAKPAG